MILIRSVAKRITSPNFLGFLPVLALLVGMLACTRADVPPPAAIGSGGLPSPTVAATLLTQEPTRVATLGDVLPLPSETPWADRPEPIVSPTFPATPTTVLNEEPEILLYEAEPGDTVRTVAIRFGVIPEDITSPDSLPTGGGMINPGQLLLIPRRLTEIGPEERIIPDSELIFSPHATDFDVVEFAANQDGYLNSYREIVGSIWRSGPEVVEIVAKNNSVNPRLLLALLEYQAGWVTDPTPASGDAFTYPMGHLDSRHMGLQRQLTWLANELGNGYYGWRAGTVTELRFGGGLSMRLAPTLNAATVGLHFYFSLDSSLSNWETAIIEGAFLETYTRLFGDPWSYEYFIFEPGVEQPELILPFFPDRIWSFTGGPHGAWERESAWAALDFAPAASESGCVLSEDWVVASAPGQVIRSENGTVVIDLDGDGRENSGWALLYLHVDKDGRVAEGEFVEEGDRLGHPSCEGGTATGTHVHIARKYNGEWILADGPLPFTLSGWIAQAGLRPYQGALVKDGEEVLACPCASQETLIWR
jgi:LasA protease